MPRNLNRNITERDVYYQSCLNVSLGKLIEGSNKAYNTKLIKPLLFPSEQGGNWSVTAYSTGEVVRTQISEVEDRLNSGTKKRCVIGH